MKAFKITAFIILGLIVLVMLGPRMAEPVLNKELPVVGGSVEQYVTRIEAAEKVRPGNEAKIVWANDSLKTPTEYVFLYLHGFSASRREGYPVNENVPKLLGANAYLARLASHGLVTDNPLIDMSPDRLYESAKQALIIASQLGQKVVVIGTSTGGTLALMLAADFPDKVNSLVLYSPNIQIKQKSAQFLSMPWGLQIARLNFGGDFRVTDDDPNGEICKYWYCRYRAEGPVYLQQLVASRMSRSTFEKVKCPVFLGYYYKDEQHQDQTVEVKAALRMFEQLGTTANLKRAVAFPEAGAHVIACDLTSGSVADVQDATLSFAREVIGIQ